MTEPVDFDRSEQLLPGLAPPKRGEPLLVVAARRTITALEGAGYLDERHAVLCQLMLDMADVVDTGRRNGRASAAAMAAAQLTAAYELMLPEAAIGGEGDGAWDELVASLRRSATAARDQAESAPPD